MNPVEEFRDLIRDSSPIDLVHGCGLVAEAGGYDGARDILADQFDTLAMNVDGSDLVGVVRSLREIGRAHV